MSADAHHDRALVMATWSLVAVTVVLCIVTAMLADATWTEKEGHGEAPVATQEVVHRDR
jgi:hypothetical protein